MSRSFRSVDWFALLALAGVLLIPVTAVVAAAWVAHLDLLYLVALTGLAVGLAFATTRWPGLLLHPLALLGGSLFTIDLVAGTLPYEDRLDRWQRLGERLISWFRLILAGGAATDNVLFLLVLAGITWGIAYLGAWSVFRRGSAWLPILSTGTALLLNVAQAPELRGFVLS